ncbi:SAM-dependent methyltransferase [Kribbella sancticallisti]|uniref:SAM-dependent methyltransferase n=1 Tax=Kribbella sancticallisti TaxID=460087 RepID=A0ABP4QN50_9ACTN
MPNETSPSEAKSAPADTGSCIDDPRQPSTARLWNLAGGGKDNFLADRVLYEGLAQATAHFSDLEAANKHFVRGAAAFLTSELGITQYIDLGVGLPTPDGNLHDVVQSLNPHAKVVYVDQVPSVLAHAHGLLAVNERVLVVDGDIFDPAQLLQQPELTTFLDWSAPIAIFCTAVLHYHPGAAPDVATTMQTYVDALATGSCTVITHFLDPEDATSSVVRQIEKTLTTSTIGAGWFRSHEEIEAMFPGQALLPPGVVPCVQWWPKVQTARDNSWIENCIAGGIGQKA